MIAEDPRAWAFHANEQARLERAPWNARLPSWLKRLLAEWCVRGLDCDVVELIGDAGATVEVQRSGRPSVRTHVRAPVWSGERLEVLTATGAHLPARFVSWSSWLVDLGRPGRVWARVRVGGETLEFSAGTGACRDAPLWLSRAAFDRLRRSYELLGGRTSARRAPVGGHDAPSPAELHRRHASLRYRRVRRAHKTTAATAAESESR